MFVFLTAGKFESLVNRSVLLFVLCSHNRGRFKRSYYIFSRPLLCNNRSMSQLFCPSDVSLTVAYFWLKRLHLSETRLQRAKCQDDKWRQCMLDARSYLCRRKVRHVVIHADDVLRRGYSDHFVTVCMCVGVYVSTIKRKPLIGMTRSIRLDRYMSIADITVVNIDVSRLLFCTLIHAQQVFQKISMNVLALWKKNSDGWKNQSNVYDANRCFETEEYSWMLCIHIELFLFVFFFRIRYKIIAPIWCRLLNCTVHSERQWLCKRAHTPGSTSAFASVTTTEHFGWSIKSTDGCRQTNYASLKDRQKRFYRQPSCDAAWCSCPLNVVCAYTK